MDGRVAAKHEQASRSHYGELPRSHLLRQIALILRVPTDALLSDRETSPSRRVWRVIAIHRRGRAFRLGDENGLRGRSKRSLSPFGIARSGDSGLDRTAKGVLPNRADHVDGGLLKIAVFAGGSSEHLYARRSLEFPEVAIQQDRYFTILVLQQNVERMGPLVGFGSGHFVIKGDGELALLGFDFRQHAAVDAQIFDLDRADLGGLLLEWSPTNC